MILTHSLLSERQLFSVPINPSGKPLSSIESSGQGSGSSPTFLTPFKAAPTALVPFSESAFEGEEAEQPGSPGQHDGEMAIINEGPYRCTISLLFPDPLPM